MKREIPITDLSDNNSFDVNIELASFCPICGNVLTPDALYSVLIPTECRDSDRVYILNYCNNCCECFISIHCPDSNDDEFIFESSAPIKKIKHVFPDSIRELSPDFVSVYNESLLAESQGMLSICGMGYRKALEFLVKDYACHLSPDKAEHIKSAPLSQVIKSHIHEEKIQSLATASAWLGNDQTHYVRKHEGYGLQELKSFITTMSAFIDYNLSWEKSKKFIQSR